MRAGGGYESVKGSSRSGIGYRRGRLVNATPSSEIQVRLHEEWGSEGDRGQLRGYEDSGRGFRVESGGGGGVRRSLGHELSARPAEYRRSGNTKLEKMQAEIDGLEQRLYSIAARKEEFA